MDSKLSPRRILRKTPSLYSIRRKETKECISCKQVKLLGEYNYYGVNTNCCSICTFQKRASVPILSKIY